MCMENVSRWKPKNCEIAYKVLTVEDGGFITPCTCTPVKIDEPLKASGKPVFTSNSFLWFLDRRLYGGAIHCFRYLDDAHGFAHIKYDKIFKVKGKNYICHNSKHIAFEEIEFLEEINYIK